MMGRKQAGFISGDREVGELPEGFGTNKDEFEEEFEDFFSFHQTIDERGVGGKGDRFGGDVKLNVISITLEMN